MKKRKGRLFEKEAERTWCSVENHFWNPNGGIDIIRRAMVRAYKRGLRMGRSKT